MPSPVTTIRADTGWEPLNLGDVWWQRTLLWVFTLRDLKTSYKQTVLGPIWAIMPPLMTTLMFTVLFGVLMGRGNEPTLPGVPYALSTLCALLPWRLFAGSLVGISNSLANNQTLIGKVYFPRMIFPLAAVTLPLLDATVTFVLLVTAMFCFGLVPSWTIVAVPLLAAFALAAALAIGLWFAPLSAIYRDVGMGVPYLLHVAMYASPVIYAAARLQATLPGWAMRLYWLNPLAVIIEGTRWAAFGGTPPPWSAVAATVVTLAALLTGGAYFFRRMERSIIDVI